MKLIVTRPEQDAATLTEMLQGRGHQVVYSPLIKITPRDNVAIPDFAYQAVCLTSANAARHLPLGLKNKNTAFTPGAQSASAAISAGFMHVEARGGNVEGMAAHIINCLKPERGPVLYISGSETSGDLAGLLRQSGFDVVKIVAYDAVAQPLRLSADEIAACDGVLLYSRRTAKIWADEMARLDFFPRLTHFGLSEQITEVLPEKWRRRTASEPTEPSMLALIDLVVK